MEEYVYKVDVVRGNILSGAAIVGITYDVYANKEDAEKILQRCNYKHSKYNDLWSYKGWEELDPPVYKIEKLTVVR